MQQQPSEDRNQPLTVEEPLRDQIARALYEEPGRVPLDGRRSWYELDEERRHHWRKDADRTLAVIARYMAQQASRDLR